MSKIEKKFIIILNIKLNMDPDKSNEINGFVNECPICYVSTIITSKFKCSHKVCNSCFRKQLESEQKLACSLCRAKICIKKLTKGQKKIYKKRDNQHILHFTPLPNNNEETEIPNIRILPMPDFNLPITPLFPPQSDFFSMVAMRRGLFGTENQDNERLDRFTRSLHSLRPQIDRLLEENNNNNLNQET